MAERAPFRKGDYNTQLSPLEEYMFRAWAKANRVPFAVEAQQSDYDMRGFWRALQQGNPQAQTAINPNDNRIHYPDYWKTPLHKSFSNESQWAGSGAPQWANDSQLAQSGRVVYDEKPRGILDYFQQGILGQ